LRFGNPDDQRQDIRHDVPSRRGATGKMARFPPKGMPQ
jgi:hypothetical protein